MFGLLSALWPFSAKNDQSLDLEAEAEALVQSVVNHVFQEDDPPVALVEQDYDVVPPVEQDYDVVPPVEQDDELQKAPCIKPMYFPLQTLTPAAACQTLKAAGLAVPLTDLREHRGAIRMGRLAIPVDRVDFYHTILGAHNYFLNRTCETWGLLAIYPEGNEVVFWGTRAKVIKAMNVLRWRIHVCGRRFKIDTSAF